MSTHDPHRSRRSQTWTRWSVPAVAVAIGAAYLVAGLVGHDHVLAVSGPLVMLAAAAAFVVAARYSETVSGLRERRDERLTRLDADAAGTAGVVVLLAVLVMFVVEVARGHTGSPYSQLGALGGVTYVVTLVWSVLRR